MKKLAVFPLCLGCVLAAATSHAIDLKQSKITQVVNDVQIISAEDQKQKTAAINDIFSMPDILRTGAASRAELVAQDETVTRVGANTIFSFDPANRTIDLKQGSLLFHSPHGKGGGTIHTGSATASVLGTTLIVVDTPNGGLKVIALEGKVQVSFTNGLQQKLDPGQMTFVLPGADQLSPIILFRLDELTQASLLVKGFSQPLSSLPLIQNQVDKQLKQITSGKISDTGLNVGDNATSTQVEVLDPNTVSGNQQQPQSKILPPPPSSPPPPPPPPPLVFNATDAESADATINQPSLTDPSIPTPPLHIYTGFPLTISGNPFFNGQSFVGFIARNILVNTPAAGLNPLIVNMSFYSGLSTFGFVALGGIAFEGSVTFKGLAPHDNIEMIAGADPASVLSGITPGISFAPGISVRADVNNFLFLSPADMTLDNVSLYNLDKDINLNSSGNIFVQDNSLINANGRINLNASADISVADSLLTSDSALLTSLNGNIIFNNAEMDTAGHAIFLAPTTITLNNSTINSDFVTLSGTSSTTISLNNTTINAPSEILASTTGEIDVTGTPPEEEGGIAAQHSAHDVTSSSTSSLNADANVGAVTLASSGASINVTGTSITAHYLTLNSGDGILLDGSGQTFSALGSGSTATFTAPNLITINNADLTSYAAVNMAANTIDLFNVAFSGTVNLKSLLGIWYNGFMSGAVNNLGGNTYDGVPIVAPNGSTGLLPGTGIFVGTINGSSVSSGAVNSTVSFNNQTGISGSVLNKAMAVGTIH